MSNGLYDRPSLKTVHKRMEADMESRLRGNTPLLTRAVLRVITAVLSGAIHIMYGLVDIWAKQLFVTHATKKYLDRHGRLWSVTRKAAAKATGVLTFAGTNGTLIPAGTRVSTADGIELATDVDATVSSGTAAVASTAVDAGAAGNVATTTSVELLKALSGITGVSVSTAFTGGLDAEKDETYRARILARIQQAPAKCTAADVARWAKEVDGVTQAWTFAGVPGPGQATVVFRGTALAATVQAYIDVKKTVTADITATAATDKTVDYTIEITPNTSALQTAITANLQQLHEEIAEPGADLLMSQIRGAISAAGVADYEITKIEVDGTPVADLDADVDFTGFEYPAFSTITFNTLSA